MISTRTLRYMVLAPLLLLAAIGTAQQQYFIHLSGHHTPCTADVQDGFVHIVSLPGTIPSYDIEVPINGNCYYTALLELNSLEYGFSITSGCASPITIAFGDSLTQVPPLGTTVNVVNDFDCGETPPDCQAAFTVTQTMVGGEPVPFSATFTDQSTGTFPISIQWWFFDGSVASVNPTSFLFPATGYYPVCLTIADQGGCTSIVCDSVFVDVDGNVGGIPESFDCMGIPNGPNLPGTPCSVPNVGDGIWNSNCDCIPNSTEPCTAGFWVIQAYTWTDTLNNPGGGGIEPIPFELWVWNLSSGGTGNYQFFWDFGDGTTSSDPFPTHVYGASGPYELCLTITDDAGCTDTYCETINVDEDGNLGMAPGGDNRSVLTIHVIQELPTGIAEQPSLETINLWPNPVEGTLNLSLRSSRSGTLILTIIDMNGKVLSEMSTAVAAGNNLLPMDVSGLARGLYVLRLNHGNNSAALRFVKD